MSEYSLSVGDGGIINKDVPFMAQHSASYSQHFDWLDIPSLHKEAFLTEAESSPGLLVVEAELK